MALLNQIVALHNGARKRSDQSILAAHVAFQKPTLLAGIEKRYQPRDDDGETLAGEKQRVQVTVADELDRLRADLARSLDVSITLDSANAFAKADIVVGDVTLLADVPVTHLLPLQKRLQTLRVFVENLPTLDTSERWEYDEDLRVYRSEPVTTVRQKKVPRNHVKAAATDKHPAQVEVYYEDVIVGDWTTTKFSGAIPQSRRREILQRLDALIEGVAAAREQANSVAVTDRFSGDVLTGYLFG